MCIDISLATRDDIESLADLLGVLFVQEADFAPDKEKQARALRLMLDTPALGVILVARQRMRRVGMVSLLFTVSTVEGGPVSWLEDMVVHPQFRRRGIGAALLEAAMAEVRARGMSRITPLTDAANSGAQSFYARAGFVRSDMIPMRLRGLVAATPRQG